MVLDSMIVDMMIQSGIGFSFYGPPISSLGFKVIILGALGIVVFVFIALAELANFDFENRGFPLDVKLITGALFVLLPLLGMLGLNHLIAGASNLWYWAFGP
jgi:hypothetical protein